MRRRSDVVARHHSRNMCSTCLAKARAADTLEDHPRLGRTRDELMDDWTALRLRGFNKVQAAKKLGMDPKSFDRQYQRARAAGDPRARTKHDPA